MWLSVCVEIDSYNGWCHQSITFEASDRSRSLPLVLIHILASELSLATIREIAR